MPNPHDPSQLPGLLERLSAHDRPIPAHPNEAASQARSFGERVSDGVAATAGSWTFIILFVSSLGVWIAMNSLQGDAAFDPFPFILLNLLLSCVAALQAPIIMMSQNRQAARDRLHADLDYQVNVKAELELVQMRAELEELRNRQWEMLMQIQREQLELLNRLAAHTAEHAAAHAAAHPAARTADRSAG